MSLLDARQRPGYLFAAITIGHIVLISTQVTSDRGIPVLETVTFGAFAEVQRGASAVVGSVRTRWGDYVALRAVRDDNARLREELSRMQIALQQERAMAPAIANARGTARPTIAVALDDGCGECHRRKREPRISHLDGGQGDGRSARA